MVEEHVGLKGTLVRVVQKLLNSISFAWRILFFSIRVCASSIGNQNVCQTAVVDSHLVMLHVLLGLDVNPMLLRRNNTTFTVLHGFTWFTDDIQFFYCV